MKICAILLLAIAIAGCSRPSAPPTEESVKELTARLQALEKALQEQSNTVVSINAFNSSQLGIDQSHREQLETLSKEIDKEHDRADRLQHLLITVSDRTLPRKAQ